MENASKALIIVGGILIAVLILSLGAYLLNSTSNFTGSYSKKISQDEINRFNNKFLMYAKDLTPQEMVSVINLITENNMQNKDNADNQVKLVIDNKIVNVNKVTQEWKNSLLEQTNVDNRANYKFISVSYNEKNGKVKELVWETL